MLLITKDLAEAVVDSHTLHSSNGYYYCAHCEASINESGSGTEHTPECIVTRAKLLLELE